jgi:hypothetical protein
VDIVIAVIVIAVIAIAVIVIAVKAVACCDYISPTRSVTAVSGLSIGTVIVIGYSYSGYSFRL